MPLLQINGNGPLLSHRIFQLVTNPGNKVGGV